MNDPFEGVDFDELEKSTDAGRHDLYILGDSENFLERMHWLRGYTDTLIGLTTDSRELRRLANLLLDLKMYKARSGRWDS